MKCSMETTGATVQVIILQKLFNKQEIRNLIFPLQGSFLSYQGLSYTSLHNTWGILSPFDKKQKICFTLVQLIPRPLLSFTLNAIPLSLVILSLVSPYP